jgi:hypothetical protein
MAAAGAETRRQLTPPSVVRRTAGHPLPPHRADPSTHASLSEVRVTDIVAKAGCTGPPVGSGLGVPDVDCDVEPVGCTVGVADENERDVDGLPLEQAAWATTSMTAMGRVIAALP